MSFFNYFLSKENSEQKEKSEKKEKFVLVMITKDFIKSSGNVWIFRLIETCGSRLIRDVVFGHAGLKRAEWRHYNGLRRHELRLFHIIKHILKKNSSQCDKPDSQSFIDKNPFTINY